jgi:HPt (histidine-containing phosphotransfer) domain-containing protein
MIWLASCCGVTVRQEAFLVALRNIEAVAFAMLGGESSSSAQHRPVDLAHLSRQTMGDRDLEREVLQLFVQQATTVRDQIVNANLRERLFLAHGLKGSARGVGAFAIAECASDIENSPTDRLILKRLARLIDEVRDFIASISR